MNSDLDKLDLRDLCGSPPLEGVKEALRRMFQEGIDPFRGRDLKKVLGGVGLDGDLGEVFGAALRTHCSSLGKGVYTQRGPIVQLIEEFFGHPIPNPFSIEAFDHAWIVEGKEDDLSFYSKKEYWPALVKGHPESLRHTQLMIEELEKDGPPKSLLDCGCGLGLFSLEIAERWPSCKVTATNLPGWQLDFNRWLFKRSGLPNLEATDARDCEGSFEALMALEYFEHFKNPQEEFRRLTAKHTPKILVESSSFSHLGLGHFREYEFDGGVLRGPNAKGAGPAYKAFTKVVKGASYARIPLKKGGWNFSRPRVWIKSDGEQPVLDMFK